MGHFHHSLTNARNIGPVIAQKLHEIGVHSLAQLAILTPVKAYIQLAKKSNGIPPLYRIIYMPYRGINERTLDEITQKIEKGIARQTGEGRKKSGAKTNWKGNNILPYSS
ncbi:TfoX/Sxy family protein [Niabella defluvii]|nr:TfoX/Sxy family protein [Niabella sp. I65]